MATLPPEKHEPVPSDQEAIGTPEQSEPSGEGTNFFTLPGIDSFDVQLVS